MSDQRARDGRPNILFLFPDQLRHDWAGQDSSAPLRTPNLDALRARGATFTNAVCPSPLCAPSRACLALGLEYDASPVRGNPDNLPFDRPSVYGLLRDAGYHVMGCGKFDLNKGDCIAGRDAWGPDGKRNLAEWGFSDGVNNEGKYDGVNSGRETPRGPYMRYLEERGERQAHVADFAARGARSAFPTPLSDEDYCDNWIGRNGLNLLDAAPSGTPWFLQVNFAGPHNPWDITAGMRHLYAGIQFPPPTPCAAGDARAHQEVRRNYAAMVENIDTWVGRYVTELERRGELDNTVIVFSSDHGEMLGERGRWGKSAPYQPSVGVPLIVAGPGVAPGAVRREPTTILDLASTFLAYAGVRPPDDMESVSLRGALEHDGPGARDVVRSGLGEWRVAFDGRWKMIARENAPDELYDLRADPQELDCLPVAAAPGAVARRLADALERSRRG
ncbi:sulfatase-like hydrolase/transferase [Candidatus Poribacteria bacterium]|nr:sulfatase-like hydrolase/transferase [Candidatus Poribacteria bacterium]MBT7097584.1 sulfatase-like hydrolase/transferase [Candidatus Poribacteria bacterium]MBT7807729.1 sulfatase-like hydrolase/transferase [Candidatus Poribacteria bacterium]